MLCGTYIQSLDAKCRLVVPSAFRAHLGSAIVLSASPDLGLLLFSHPAWLRYARGRISSPSFRTLCLGSAQTVHPNASAFRIPIPESLRVYAGLTPLCRVAVVASGSLITLYSYPVWLSLVESARCSLAAASRHHA